MLPLHMKTIIINYDNNLGEQKSACHVSCPGTGIWSSGVMAGVVQNKHALSSLVSQLLRREFVLDVSDWRMCTKICERTVVTARAELAVKRSDAAPARAYLRRSESLAELWVHARLACHRAGHMCCTCLTALCGASGSSPAMRRA